MSLKKNLENYRKGASGALVDEYEKALGELKIILQSVSESDYALIADYGTNNEDCRSIATIANHVIQSGYAYAGYIRKGFKISSILAVRKNPPHQAIATEIDQMFAFTVETFEGRWELMDAAMDNHLIERWGASYSLEQMMEHAIVHVLRHRRQIEKFILKFKAA